MRPIKPISAMLVLGLSACNPWANLPSDHYGWIDSALWDPTTAVAAGDGVYIALPHAGGLVRAKDDGTFSTVDLSGAEVVRMVATPDAQSVMVWDRWQVCVDPDVELASDCLDGELSWSYELAIITDGTVSTVTQIPPQLNSLAFSPDGKIAVAYLDYDSQDEIPVDGVVDLTQVAFIDLASGEQQSVSVGFSANNVIFSQDGTRAVVLSQSQVVVVDLATFEPTVRYPLTLSADQQVDPSSAVLTPDGRYVLITVIGSSDLYKLDLEIESIDIISLDSPPAELSVNNNVDRSVLVYSGLSRVDVMEHTYFDIQSVSLHAPTTSVIEAQNFALLYNDVSNYRYVYKLDFDTLEPTEYVLGNPANNMQLTASERYAVSVLRPESGTGNSGLEGYQDSHYGLGVIDLDQDQEISLVLESEPVGTAVVEDDAGSYALLLLDGRDSLLKVDLSAPSAPETIDLEAPPLGIGTLPDGRFFITHDSPLGLVSFLDPTDNSITSTAGFGVVDLMADDTLPRRGQEN